MKILISSEKGFSKIWILVILIAVLAVGICTFAIINFNQKNEDDNSPKSSSISDNKKSSNKEDSSENDNKNETKSGKYWYEKNSDVKQNKKFNLNLYDGKLDTPVDLTQLDDFATEYNCYPDGTGLQKVSNFSDLLNISDEFTNYCSVWITCKNSNVPIRVFFENNSDDPLTLKECYENGWWSFSEEYYPEYLLGINNVVDEELMDIILEKLGGPTHVYQLFGLGTFKIDYEYDDFVIRININDFPEYDNLIVDSVEYLTKEQAKLSLKKYDSNDFKKVK